MNNYLMEAWQKQINISTKWRTSQQELEIIHKKSEQTKKWRKNAKTSESVNNIKWSNMDSGIPKRERSDNFAEDVFKYVVAKHF